MNKAQVAKVIAKLTIGAVSSVMIGATIRQEKHIAALLDAHFADKPNV
jgi:hypothetical protein